MHALAGTAAPAPIRRFYRLFRRDHGSEEAFSNRRRMRLLCAEVSQKIGIMVLALGLTRHGGAGFPQGDISHAKTLSSRDQRYALFLWGKRNMGARRRVGRLRMSPQPEGGRLPLPPGAVRRPTFRFEGGDAQSTQGKR